MSLVKGLRYNSGQAKSICGTESSAAMPRPLTKLGVREKLALEELVDRWTVQFLSVAGGSLDPNTFKLSSRRFKRSPAF